MGARYDRTFAGDVRTFNRYRARRFDAPYPVLAGERNTVIFGFAVDLLAFVALALRRRLIALALTPLTAFESVAGPRSRIMARTADDNQQVNYKALCRRRASAIITLIVTQTFWYFIHNGPVYLPAHPLSPR